MVATSDRANLELRRRLRRLSRDTVESFRESQWRLPVLGTVVGAALGWALALYGNPPAGWSVTVGGARNGLLSVLAIVFTALSIVLAVSSVTTQNVVGRYSLRMMRIYLRESRDSAVVAVFGLTAAFILTVIVQYRKVPVDESAPLGGLAVSVLLLVVVGVAMIWHISATTSWFRVDLAVQRVSRLALRTARRLERQRRGDRAVDAASFVRPEGAIPIRAANSGYLIEVDTGGLFDLALDSEASITVDKELGQSVVAGEPIGWISGSSAGDESLESIGELIDISELRDPGEDPAYAIAVLVDIAIMALSPAVNDPNTAVQVIEGLTFLLPELADKPPGLFGRLDSSGEVRVAAAAPSFKDYVDLATTQIVLYGESDPLVLAALRRLANVLSLLDVPEDARAAIATMRSRVGSVDTGFAN